VIKDVQSSKTVSTQGKLTTPQTLIIKPKASDNDNMILIIVIIVVAVVLVGVVISIVCVKKNKTSTERERRGSITKQPVQKPTRPTTSAMPTDPDKE